MPENISIESDKGITVETPPLRIAQEYQVDWRI